MKQLLSDHYTGTKLGISGWNWGADKTIDGALAIADDVTPTLDLHNIALVGQTKLCRYSAAMPNAITSAPFTLGANRSLTLPAYSIPLPVLEAQQP
jgi:hypothetical protein